jgi:hypothetical protein
MIPLLLLACSGSIETATTHSAYFTYPSTSLIASTSEEAPNSLSFTLSPTVSGTLTCTSTTIPEEQHRISTDANSNGTTLFGLLADHTYHCMLEEAEEDYNAYVTTPPLPEDLPLTTLTFSKAHNTYTLFHYGDRLKLTQKILVVVDPMGEVRWFYKPILPTFIDVDATFTSEGNIHFGGGGGGLDLLDQEATVPKTINLSGEVLYAVPVTGEYGFHHHAQSLGANESLTLLYQSNIVESAEVHGSTLLHFDLTTGKTLWSWSTQQAIDSAAINIDLSIVPNAIHPNWAAKRKNDYLISLFHNKSIISVGRETGEVQWRLGADGDFVLYESDGSIADEQRWFLGIHGADLTDDSLVVYDNLHSPNNDDDYISRVVRITLDETNMHAIITGEYTEPGWLEPILGSVQSIGNDDVLIGMGHCLACESVEDMPIGKNHNSAIVRVDLALGEPWWRLDFEDSSAIIYRATQTEACSFLPTNQRYCTTNADKTLSSTPL